MITWNLNRVINKELQIVFILRKHHKLLKKYALIISMGVNLVMLMWINILNEFINALKNNTLTDSESYVIISAYFDIHIV
jgi:hypothetical protein